MSRYIHPFPARMAPELAVAELKRLEPHFVVLDPMAGSGTVLREALEFGHEAIGFDMDPLAVLMSSVRSTPVDTAEVTRLADTVLGEASSLNLRDVVLPWIDEDDETQAFTKFWFADRQRNDLRRIACILWNLQREANSLDENAAINALRLH